MLDWFWNLLGAIQLRWAYWQRKAIKCDLCKNLSWNGFQHDDGSWTCCTCCEAGTKETPPWKNRRKEPVHVNWLMLEEAGREDSFKRVCPVCGDGLLMGHRSSETQELLEWDLCTLCGQVVIYDDIELARKIHR